MGQQNSKISSKSVSPQQLVRKEPVEVGLYFYPFKQFTKLQNNQDSDHAILEMIKPYQDSIKVSTRFYPELEKALFEVTFDIRIEQVFFDTFNFDRVFYRGWDHHKPISFVQRKFKQFESQLYKSILYQKHIYETINRLESPNLIKLNDSFCINTNLQEEYPFTYFFIYQNLPVNLSQIIKYRRDNNCEWYVTEFQKLCWDLVSALDQLHQTNITHNDIRPCNVFYSTEKECYVLGEFSNALKTDPHGNFLNVRTRTHPSFMISEKELSSPTLRDVFINHKRADIYALGITLLCAFYMTEPVERRLAAPINRMMQEKYEIMKVLRKMVKKSDKQITIEEIKSELRNCNKKSDMSHMVRSIKFRHKPKTKQLPMIYLTQASAYKRLGLWQEWRNSLESAYETAEGHITQIEQAEYCNELSRVQKLLENHHKSDGLGEKAANLYYEIGSKYLEENNITQAFNAFNKGMKALNYCFSSNKIVLVKILQSLSILYFHQNQPMQSIACLKQSKLVLKRTYSESIQDYYEIKTQQVKIHQIHSNFNEAEKFLKELLNETIKHKDYFGKIQFLRQLGLNAIKKAQNPRTSLKNTSQNFMAVSSPLKHSEARKIVDQDSRVTENEQGKEYKRLNFQQAESYFKEASDLIMKKMNQMLKNPGFVKRKTIGKDETDLQDSEIESQNASIQNLLILKSLGEIKFKQTLTERADDYFYKVLGQIDKIIAENDVSHIQVKKESTQNLIQVQPIQKQNHSESGSHKSDFLQETFSQTFNRATTKNIETTKPQTTSTKVLKRPKRLLNKGDLIKMKADVECSIALCKQQQGDFQQMLNYYNKSLVSYKSYYGQFHNKLCGIIIGSMALGYQKVNQHNKALECIELATEILRDVEPANSPDLKHFQKMRRHVIKEESMAEKKLDDKKYIEIAHTRIADILSSILGLKMNERKKTSLKSKKSFNSTSSVVNSIEYNEMKSVEQRSEPIQIEECESQYCMSDTSSLRQIELPVKVVFRSDSESIGIEEFNKRSSQPQNQIRLITLNDRFRSSSYR